MIKFKWETEFKQTEIGEVPSDFRGVFSHYLKELNIPNIAISLQRCSSFTFATIPIFLTSQSLGISPIPVSLNSVSHLNLSVIVYHLLYLSSPQSLWIHNSVPVPLSHLIVY